MSEEGEERSRGTGGGPPPPLDGRADAFLQETWANANAHLRHGAAGALAGAAAKTVTAPLDRLKIMFQVGQQRFSLRAGGAALREAVAREGARSLWRGHSATLLRIVPYAGLHYAAHEAAAEALAARRARAGGGGAGWAERFGAGAAAGAAASLATYPLDLLRARLAVASLAGGAAAPSLAASALGLARGGGAFRGLGPTLLGIVPYSGVTWLGYTTLRERGSELGLGEGAGVRLAAGALAGLAGQTATYPLDVARRRMQVGGPAGQGSALAVLRRAVAAEGATVLWRGVTLNWVKGPVATAVSFCCFEGLLGYGSGGNGGGG